MKGRPKPGAPGLRLVVLVTEQVGLERREAPLAHLPRDRPHARHVGDLRLVMGPARGTPGDAVRPVDAQAVADPAAQQFITGHAERPRLGVEQGVLDGAERLAHHSARAGPRHAGQVLADRLVVHHGLADHARRELRDDRADSRRPERFVELAPADHAVLGGDLDEVVVAPCGAA